jgi:hypothetical protein
MRARKVGPAKEILREIHLAIIAFVGCGMIPASVACAESPSSATLCPDGFYIEKAFEKVASWRLLLHGAFAQAEINNSDGNGDEADGAWALISCRYGGDSVGVPGSHMAGSYSLSLYRAHLHCQFVAVAGARIEQVPSDLNGTKLRCKGARDACVAVCDQAW